MGNQALPVLVAIMVGKSVQRVYMRSSIIDLKRKQLHTTLKVISLSVSKSESINIALPMRPFTVPSRDILPINYITEFSA